jgi:hypothetical protein
MEQDLRFGSEQEIIVLPILQNFFNDALLQKCSKYSTIDFQSPTHLIELKSRNNTLLKYPTTLLPFNKVVPTDKSLIFAFKFTDCITFIRYDKNLFDSFEKKPFRRYRPGVFDKEVDYLHIPIENLTVIQ